MKVQSFDLYVTFGQKSDCRFYKADGQPTFNERDAKKIYHSISELFVLGEKAFNCLDAFYRLEDSLNTTEPITLYETLDIHAQVSKIEMVDELRKDNVLILNSLTYKDLPPSKYDLADTYGILGTYLNHYSSLGKKLDKEKIDEIAICYLIAIFEYIDIVITGMLSKKYEIGAALIASDCLTNFHLLCNDLDIQGLRSGIGRQAAEARIKKDPRQQEKQLIKECWQNWQADKSQYKSKAAFARDMMEKVEHLTSAKKIEDWCREWEKETTTQPVR